MEGKVEVYKRWSQSKKNEEFLKTKQKKSKKGQSYQEKKNGTAMIKTKKTDTKITKVFKKFLSRIILS